MEDYRVAELPVRIWSALNMVTYAPRVSNVPNYAWSEVLKKMQLLARSLMIPDRSVPIRHNHVTALALPVVPEGVVGLNSVMVCAGEPWYVACE